MKEIIKGFNKTAVLTEKKGFAIIIDDTGKCVGVVSDGDIRRQLVKDSSLDAPVETAMNRMFTFVRDTDNDHTILRQFDKKVANLPVLNDADMPIDLYRYSKFLPANRTEERIIRARVPVRVSYSGGGTDMSSYINQIPATVLSSTINKYCTASVIIRKDDEIHITSKDLNIKYKAKKFDEIEFGDELDLIKAAVKIMEPNYGFELETYAEFDIGTGLGGSSAVVVSVLGALNYFRNEQHLDIYQLADLAYQVERIDMNIVGGWQDQYATIFGGFSWIEFKHNEVLVTPMQLHRNTLLELEYNLMLFRIGRSHDSSKIQKNFINKIEKQNTHESFAEMNSLSNRMKKALLKGEVKLFADMLHESWSLKKKINDDVTNDFVTDCYDTARDLGALGGKLLGAGGSGYLLIYSSPLYQRQIKKALEDKGAKQELFKFSTIGLEVWSTRK